MDVIPVSDFLIFVIVRSVFFGGRVIYVLFSSTLEPG